MRNNGIEGTCLSLKQRVDDIAFGLGLMCSKGVWLLEDQWGRWVGLG